MITRLIFWASLVYKASLMIASAPIVPQALYAQLSGIKGKSIIIYRGGYTVHPLSIGKKLGFLVQKPVLTFFNGKNEPIVTEVSHSPQDIDAFIKTIQKRVGLLPEVAAIDVVAFKAAGHQSIEMFDKDGNKIVTTNYSFYALKGSHLSQKAIDDCSSFVSNPEALKTLRVNAYNTNIITGEKILIAR